MLTIVSLPLDKLITHDKGDCSTGLSGVFHAELAQVQSDEHGYGSGTLEWRKGEANSDARADDCSQLEDRSSWYRLYHFVERRKRATFVDDRGDSRHGLSMTPLRRQERVCCRRVRRPWLCNLPSIFMWSASGLIQALSLQVISTRDPSSRSLPTMNQIATSCLKWNGFLIECHSRTIASIMDTGVWPKRSITVR